MFWRSLPNDNVKFSYLRFWRQRELAEVNLSFFAFTWKTFVPSKWKCTPPILYNVTTLFGDWHETDDDDQGNELSQFCVLCVTIMFAFSFVLLSAFAYAIRSAASMTLFSILLLEASQPGTVICSVKFAKLLLSWPLFCFGFQATYSLFFFHFILSAKSAVCSVSWQGLGR